ncbi:Zn-ribbon domain-containing OB-fold protein [Sphingopyxis sp. FD7]|uniref:Zn-ribbon domain-containing OB-fold protein n=1 Tax=Sphingopyxis sp. FD7 TaxID=1914525 RepID=UPI000DC61B98|nr:OB-fold domain-containing protein [Sphingopyxis sp. FD7]BBB14501.1 hypothetical protein SPYCA_3759 [Sphingopyxis sp. FD7]
MTGNSPSTGQPVVEGLFTFADGRIALTGSLCSGCGAQYFPRVEGCRDPSCASGELADCELPRSGTLYSYSWQAYRPPDLYPADDWQPYALGTVELSPGLRVLSRLDVPRSDLSIGMVLELGADVLARTDDAPVIGYVFRQGAAN